MHFPVLASLSLIVWCCVQRRISVILWLFVVRHMSKTVPNAQLHKTVFTSVGRGGFIWCSLYVRLKKKKKRKKRLRWKKEKYLNSFIQLCTDLWSGRLNTDHLSQIRPETKFKCNIYAEQVDRRSCSIHLFVVISLYSNKPVGFPNISQSVSACSAL